MTKVTIDRELLERAVKADASIGASSIALVDGWKAMAQIRAILAAPRQPEGEVVEVVGWLGGNGLHAEENMASGAPFPLMTVAQHNRILEGVRQQLAEQDAEIMEQCRLNGMGAERELKLLTERDKLAAKLTLIANTDPDSGTAWFHEVADAALSELTP